MPSIFLTRCLCERNRFLLLDRLILLVCCAFLFGRTTLGTVPLFFLLNVLVGKVHAIRVKPLGAAIAVHIPEVRVQWLLAHTVLLPVLEVWREALLDRAVGCSSEERSVEINLFKLIILFDSEHIALGDDGICKDFVLVVSQEDFIFTNEFQILLRNVQLL